MPASDTSTETVSGTSTEAHEAPATSGFWALTLGGIGVVFGDIGTSPLYAFREAVSHAASGQPISRKALGGRKCSRERSRERHFDEYRAGRQANQ